MQETLTYQERSQAFLVKAREQLEAGDFEQASEKAWGAAALMVKAVAQARGRSHRAHNQLTDIVEDLADETGDDQLSDLYDAANALHGNFYENRFRARGCAEAAKERGSVRGKDGPDTECRTIVEAVPLPATGLIILSHHAKGRELHPRPRL